MLKNDQKVDANDLVKIWQSDGVERETQRAMVLGMMTLATPLVERMAELAGALAPRGDEPLSSEYEEALDQAIGLEYVSITTIHSAMNDQPVIDAYHHEDLRRKFMLLTAEMSHADAAALFERLSSLEAQPKFLLAQD